MDINDTDLKNSVSTNIKWSLDNYIEFLKEKTIFFTSSLKFE